MNVDDGSVEYLGNNSYYYSYQGTPKKVVLKRGIYFVELWGASGGGPFGGKGGYSSGILTLHNQKSLFFYIGGQGKSYPGNPYDGCIEGGWNGGGDACAIMYQNSGGGGTDIRLSQNENYEDRIIVAGGGGSSDQIINNVNWALPGGAGGGLVGGNAYGYSQAGYDCNKEIIGDLWALGGTQTGGGDIYSSSYCLAAKSENKKGDFGKGGQCSGGNKLCGGGGGGYYGGGGGFDITGGGGGSGYFSPFYIQKGTLLNGNSTFPGKNDYETGHLGDGAIRVTILKQLMYFNSGKSIFVKMNSFISIVLTMFIS